MRRALKSPSAQAVRPNAVNCPGFVLPENLLLRATLNRNVSPQAQLSWVC